MRELLSLDEVLRRLQALCDEAGGQRALARRLGVSMAFINAALKGRARPSGAILDALGLERVMAYREKQPAQSRPKRRSRAKDASRSFAGLLIGWETASEIFICEALSDWLAILA